MELRPQGQLGSSTPVPTVPHAHRASGPVPPDLLMHIVVVSQASSFVQRLLLHGGIGSRLGCRKERRWRGASQAPRLCPPRVGAGQPYLSVPPAPPCRTPPQPGSSPCRCRHRCQAQQHPAPPGSTRCPHTRSSGGCSPPAAPHPGGGRGIRRVLSLPHHPFPMDGAWGASCIMRDEHNPKPRCSSPR